MQVSIYELSHGQPVAVSYNHRKSPRVLRGFYLGCAFGVVAICDAVDRLPVLIPERNIVVMRRG